MAATATTAAMVEERQSSTQSCLTARKSSDQFDLFAKSIAYQLRRMSSHAAAKVQMEIRSLLTNVPRDTESNVILSSVLSSHLFLYCTLNRHDCCILILVVADPSPLLFCSAVSAEIHNWHFY